MKTLEDCSMEPLPEEVQAMIFMMLGPELNNYKSDIPPEGLCIGIINERLAKVDFVITEQCLMVLGLLSLDKPAKAVMWAYTVFKLNIRSLDSLIDNFGTGYPTEESQKELWYELKDRLDDPWIWDNKHSTARGLSNRDRFEQRQDACIHEAKGH